MRFRRGRDQRSGMPGEARLLRRAARAVALQTGAAVALVVLVVVMVVLVADARQRSAAADRSARATWVSADDVDDPPLGVYLIRVSEAGRVERTPGTPASVRSLDPDDLPDGITQRTIGDARLRIYTGDKKIGRVSAVINLDSRRGERERILLMLGFAAVLAILGAVAVGALIGRRAVRPLGTAMELQRRFVTDASHELRTPLTVLLTRTQVLRRHLPAETTRTQRAEVDRIVSDARNLGAVVTDLLLSAELQHRPQAGELVDLQALVVDVVDSLQPLAVERSVGLVAAAGSGPFVVRGAVAALRRALTSLTDNAVAHTSAGGHVVLQVTGSASEVAVQVADDGEGIDPATATRLSERFARSTELGRGRRFGLGLALVQEVARAHGGRLEVDGSPGRGSRFTLHLPRRETGS